MIRLAAARDWWAWSVFESGGGALSEDGALASIREEYSSLRARG